MTHPDELLAGYVDGTLSDPERAVVDEHLRTCDRCREEIDLATRAVSALSALPTEPVPFGVTGPVLAEARKGAERRQPVWARMQWAVGIATAAALVLVAVILLPQVVGDGDDDGPALRAPAGPQAPESAAAEAAAPIPGLERLEQDLDERDLARIAKQAARPDGARSVSAAGSEPTAIPEQPDVQAPDGAVDCLLRSGATIDDESVLVRVIEASYLGTPAYVGVFLEGPGGGRSPEDSVVWVVSSADCTILTLLSRAI